MTSLAMLLQDRGLLRESEALLRDALQIYEASVGPDHQYVASTLTELGAVLTEQGSPEEAEAVLLRALGIRERDFPATHPLASATNVVYGHTLARLGRFEEAERLLLAHLPEQDAPAPALDRRTRRALEWTASLYEDWGKPGQAEHFRKVISKSAISHTVTSEN
jgi:tetratricopeptide (TPR) repeat protein